MQVGGCAIKDKKETTGIRWIEEIGLEGIDWRLMDKCWLPYMRIILMIFFFSIWRIDEYHQA